MQDVRVRDGVLSPEERERRDQMQRVMEREHENKQRGPDPTRAEEILSKSLVKTKTITLDNGEELDVFTPGMDLRKRAVATYGTWKHLLESLADGEIEAAEEFEEDAEHRLAEVVSELTVDESFTYEFFRQNSRALDLALEILNAVFDQLTVDEEAVDGFRSKRGGS